MKEGNRAGDHIPSIEAEKICKKLPEGDLSGWDEGARPRGG